MLDSYTYEMELWVDLDQMLIFCCHELYNLDRSWPVSSPNMSSSGWSGLLWLGNQNSIWPHYFLGSSALQLLISPSPGLSTSKCRLLTDLLFLPYYGIHHHTFSQAQKLCPSTLYINNLHQYYSKMVLNPFLAVNFYYHSFLLYLSPALIQNPSVHHPDFRSAPRVSSVTVSLGSLPTPAVCCPFPWSQSTLHLPSSVQNPHTVWAICKTCLSPPFDNSSRLGTMFYNFPSILHRIWIQHFNNKILLNKWKL